MRIFVIAAPFHVMTGFNWKLRATPHPRSCVHVRCKAAAHGYKYFMRYRCLIVVVLIMAVSLLLLFSVLTAFSSSPLAEAKKGPLVTDKVRVDYSCVYSVLAERAHGILYLHAFADYLYTYPHKSRGLACCPPPHVPPLELTFFYMCTYLCRCSLT